MAKKKKGSGKSVSRFLAPANATEDFAHQATLAILEALDERGRSHDRIAALTGAFDVKDEGQIYVGVRITDGMPALLPFLDRETAAGYDAKYYAKMAKLRETYGDKIQDWPKNRDLAPQMENGDMLAFAFHIEKLRSHEVSFLLSISVILGEKETLIKSRYDFDPDSFDDESMMCENNPRAIRLLLREQVNYWLFDPNTAWENSDMRDASFAITSACTRMWIAAKLWRTKRITTRHKGVAILFHFALEDGLLCMDDTPLKQECRKILGDYFAPGKSVGFLLESNIHFDGSMDISLKGPFGFDPYVIEYDHEYLELAEGANLLLSKAYPPDSPWDSEPAEEKNERTETDSVSAVIEAGGYAEEDLKEPGELDLRIADDVLKALGIEAPWLKKDKE